MNSLDELLERVKAASGADRELDCCLWAIGEGVALEWQGTSLVAGTRGVIGWIDPGKHSRNFSSNRDKSGPGGIPAYTASLDAALALVEQVLPGCGIKLHIENGRGLYGAVATILEPPTKWGEYQHEEFGKTPTLALLAALLSALIARDGAGYGTASTPGNSGRAPKPQDLSARDQ